METTRSLLQPTLILVVITDFLQTGTMLGVIPTPEEIA